MLKIILSGCCGRMGRSIAAQLKDNQDVKIVAGVDISADKYSDFPVYSTIFDVTEDSDVVIDFSHHSAVGAICEYCIDKNICVVFCTTGYTEDELELIKQTSKKIAVFRSANMSLGINVLNSLCKKAAEILKDSFDIEVVEMHHNQKLDAPSGTALLLADSIKTVVEDAEYVYDRHLERKKRAKNEIGIHALRGGTVVGEHSVIFAGPNETVTLSHSALSREVFASGAIKAAAFLKGKSAGLYDMDCLINEVLE